MIKFPKTEAGKRHYHYDRTGLLVSCYHSCKSVLMDSSFWIGTTLGFPIEHWLWEKAPGFSAVTKWMGL